jgi:hypothetical protein
MSDKLPRYDVLLGGTDAPLARFSYVHVFETHTNSESNKDEYGIQALIPKVGADGKPNPDVKTLQDRIAQIKKELFTDRKKPVPPEFWNPLRDGDKDVKQNGESFGPAAEGHFVLSTKAAEDRQPKVVGTQRDEKGKLVALTTGLKSGDYGRLGITLYGYTKGKSGVGAGLRTVQLVQQGEALGSEADPDADFGGFDEEPNVL